MSFRRFIFFTFCLILAFCDISAPAMATHDTLVKRFVTTDTTNGVQIEVEKDMLRGETFTVEGVLYKEKDWINFFVSKLLVGDSGETVTKVILRRPVHSDRRRQWLTCPPLLRDGRCFFVRRAGTDLIVVCSDLSQTAYGSWFLNESGLALSGQRLR